MTAASTSTYTKSPFASSSAPEKSHTPQQSKVGGDDEGVSTDLSASPLIDKIVQNSEQNAATSMTPSPGADRWLWNGDTDHYDAYEDTDMFGPPPASGDGVSYCMYHRLADEE
jgi:hypothetical protein